MDQQQAATNDQQAAYRRLAIAILELDVATLADKLRAERQSILPQAA